MSVEYEPSSEPLHNSAGQAQSTDQIGGWVLAILYEEGIKLVMQFPTQHVFY